MFISILLLGFCTLTAAKFIHHVPYREQYRDMSWRAVEEYNKNSDDAFHWIPVEILDVRVVHVMGLRYTIKVAIARSNCTKFAHAEPSHDRCQPQNTNDWKICTFEISHLHWKLAERIMLSTCTDYITTTTTVPTTEADWPTTSSITPPEMEEQPTTDDPLHLPEPTATLTSWDEFLGFMEKFKRVYHSVEERMKRFKIFKQNMRVAKKLQYEEKGTAVYGETQFSDLTPEEFQKIMLPSVWPTVRFSNDDDFDLEKYNLSLDNLPESFDWRSKAAVTPVKNQGSCGSCWAFSVTGNIEGLWKIKTGKLISLSEQELVDCDVIDKGCNGGLPINAFREIIRMGGLEPEDRYPYKAKNGTCHLVRKDIAVYINDSVEMPQNETVMQAWVAQKGPLSVGIDANLLAYYEGGILHPPRKRCPPSMINHGVLIVGYGVERGMPYWIIKNSWGPNWGERGYFRLKRGADVCGVRDLASSAIIY